MATQQLYCSWTHGTLQDRNDVRRASGQTLVQFAAAHVASVIAGDTTNSDTPLTCEPSYTHLVIWTKDGITRTNICTSCTSQADADDIAVALEAAITAAGGTVTVG